MDAKDILGIPKISLPLPQEKKSRPQEDSQIKPDGISQVTRVRVVNGTPPTGDYSFAKYNKSSNAFFFLSSLLPIVVHGSLPDNISQEIERKRAFSMVLSQTKHQERKDAEVLSEAKKITESRMAAKAAQDAELAVTSNISPEGVEKTGAPADTASPSSMQVAAGGGGGAAPLMSIADNAAAASASIRMLRVNLRTYALDQMVQVATSSAGLRTIKRVEQFLQELKVNLKPKVPTKAVCAEHLELRMIKKSITKYMMMQEKLVVSSPWLMKANSSGVRRGKESSS
ncbi:unnamed protein product [Lactuca virosa]|uniref:Uncharacterized protein n=1 Tax=Lactuca virosa TaxID=75947 RepID=A0AAU9PFV0_9ASTR|nr:unnamed protein product [Lactuca virosa]CAH1448783.1 unnamed protein product [Lactuca virosa]